MEIHVIEAVEHWEPWVPPRIGSGMPPVRHV